MKKWRAVIFAVTLCSCRSGYFLEEKTVIQPNPHSKIPKIILDKVEGKNTHTSIDDRLYHNGRCSRVILFIDGKPYIETINLSDTSVYVNDFKCGRLMANFIVENDSIINGTVNFFNKMGKLSIVAVFKQGEFEDVIYYRKKRHLNSFLSKNKKIKFVINK